MARFCRFTIKFEGHEDRNHLAKGEVAWFKMEPPLAFPCKIEVYLDGHLLPNNASIGDRFGDLIFRGATSDGQIRIQSVQGGIPNIKIYKTCGDCEAHAAFNVIQIEVDAAKMVGFAPDPTDPHFDSNILNYGFANIPAAAFGPQDHEFGSIGAPSGSYIQNTTGQPFTDIHIRVMNGKTIEPDPGAGGSLFPTVEYDPDGHGVTFSGGTVLPGEWIWMMMPAAKYGDYVGHLTPNK